MISTEVIWPREITQATYILIQDMLEKILGIKAEEYNMVNFTRSLREDGSIVSIRSWDTLEDAELWIEFVSSLESPPSSARII